MGGTPRPASNRRASGQSTVPSRRLGPSALGLVGLQRLFGFLAFLQIVCLLVVGRGRAVVGMHLLQAHTTTATISSDAVAAFTCAVNKADRLVLVIELEPTAEEDVMLASCWPAGNGGRPSLSPLFAEACALPGCCLQLDSWLYAIAAEIHTRHDVTPFCMAFVPPRSLARQAQGLARVVSAATFPRPPPYMSLISSSIQAIAAEVGAVAVAYRCWLAPQAP